MALKAKYVGPKASGKTRQLDMMLSSRKARAYWIDASFTNDVKHIVHIITNPPYFVKYIFLDNCQERWVNYLVSRFPKYDFYVAVRAEDYKP